MIFMYVGRFVDWGTRKAVSAAAVLLAASMFLARVASGLVGFALPLFLYGVGSGIMTPVVLDFITKRTSKEALGSAMGVHEGVYGVGMFIGPFVGGLIADVYGTSTMYTLLVGASLLILPLGYLMTVPERSNKHTSTL